MICVETTLSGQLCSREHGLTVELDGNPRCWQHRTQREVDAENEERVTMLTEETRNTLKSKAEAIRRLRDDAQTIAAADRLTTIHEDIGYPDYDQVAEIGEESLQHVQDAVDYMLTQLDNLIAESSLIEVPMLNAPEIVTVPMSDIIANDSLYGLG